MAYLKITSDAALDVEGRPSVAADDQAKHTLTVTKMVDDATPVGSGSETLRVFLDRAGVQLSADSLTLVNGSATFTVGPALVAGSLFVRVVGVDAGLKGGIEVRFSRATKDRQFNDLLVRDQFSGDTYKITVSKGALTLEKV